MITKEHFIKIARIIKEHNGGDGYINSDFIRDLADYLKEINPNFDEAKFFNACEVKE